MRIAGMPARHRDARTSFHPWNCGSLTSGILVIALAGCLDGGRAGDTTFEERILDAPFSPKVEVGIPTFGEDPLSFAGVRARNDTLFFLETETRDLWTLAVGESPHPMTRRLRGSEYELPAAAALLLWQGTLGFLDRSGVFWNMEGTAPEAMFPFRLDDAPESAPGVFLRDAVVMGDSLIVATSMTLAPPSGSLLPRTSMDLVAARANGEPHTTLAILAEGMTSMARFFALTEGLDSLWVVDPLQRQSMSPLTDPTQAWIPRPGLSYRLPTAEDLEAMAGFQQQIRQMSRQLGSQVASGFIPDHQPSIRRGYWQGQTLWAMAQSSPGFVLDGYCDGVYEGTLGPRVSAIHFAPPYLVTVLLAEDLETDNIVRIYSLLDLPELCPAVRSAPRPPRSP